jgi:hypothetical protein
VDNDSFQEKGFKIVQNGQLSVKVSEEICRSGNCRRIDSRRTPEFL